MKLALPYFVHFSIQDSTVPLCSLPYCICTVREGVIQVKVANVGLDDFIIEKGKLIGTGERDFRVKTGRSAGTCGASQAVAWDRHFLQGAEKLPTASFSQLR